MPVGVEIKDDPAHAEGGHALVLFRGIQGSSDRVRLVIELITDGHDYHGPGEVDATVLQSPEGLLLAVGDGQFDELETGLAVALSIEGTDTRAEVLWPSLKPRASGRRRSPLSGAGRRHVFTRSGVPAAKAAPTGEAARPEAPRRSPEDRDGPAARLQPGVAGSRVQPPEATGPAPAEPALPPVEPVPGRAVTPIQTPLAEGAFRANGALVQSTAAETREVAAAIRPASVEMARPRSEPQRARRWPAIVAAALVGFGAGAAAVAVIWLSYPNPMVQRPRFTTATPMPSPFDILDGLPDRSPRGLPAEAGDAATFLARSHAPGNTPAESSFWRRWAMRALLEAKGNGVASTLGDFATDMATTRADPPTFAAARLLWEMAAMGGNCTAMDNIAVALAADRDPALSGQAPSWQKRAQQCRDRAKAER